MTDEADNATPVKHTLCQNCGGDLEFQPGTRELVCPYCQTRNEIEDADAAVQELDYHAFLREAASAENTEERLTVACDQCGAHVQLPPNVTADECTFCGSTLNAEQHSERVLRPRSLLPFRIDIEGARERFKKWIQGLWFAPNALKERARANKLSGVYAPFWTYDSRTTTHYTGQRGEYYYVTVHYTTRENGKTVRKSRRERRTRWYPASGIVQNAFDDLLVRGSRTLPEKLARKLEPWDLQSLVPYQAEYLSGFTVESYGIGLDEGFETAKGLMEPTIRGTIRSDIGGDEQRIHSTDTHYSDITFKHILLPIWISAYHFKEKTYRFLVNARTGEVQGERPWSVWKIVLLVLGILAAGGGIAVLIAAAQGGFQGSHMNFR